MKRFVSRVCGLLYAIAFVSSFVVFAVGFALPSAVSGEHKFFHENVLGTSCEIGVHCESAALAGQMEALILQEVDRLSSVLSTYDAESEISRLLAKATRQETQAVEVSPPLLAVLRAAEDWRVRTGGAFDVRAAALTNAWKSAAALGKVPTDAQRQRVVSELQATRFEFSQGLVRLPLGQLSVDGLAKGYILDHVTEVVLKQPGVDSCYVNIGGDIRVRGVLHLDVRVADPANAAENARQLLDSGAIHQQAIATSGNYRRGIMVGDRRVSHIFDPRSGLPCDHVRSASVIAPNALAADALATALCVLGQDTGIRLVEQLDGFECAMQLSDGRLARSSGWAAAPMATMLTAKEDKKSVEGLFVSFALDRPKGRRYRRPFVAIWLEDKDGFPVKTALLWLQTEQPGPRWHRDLTRWYRNNRMRKTVEKRELIGTVSGATRGPGEYEAHFDGTDNSKKPLPDGKYMLCLEVAREHGTYQIIREPLELGQKKIELTKLDPNKEMKDVQYRFVPIGSASDKQSIK